ncbi:TraY domain-containing protein [Nitrosomonas sp. sh817]|uniref:type II toxin-antitoxin system RelB family antitoxin n=1 Tax=Nitrosomonas sp. sh817 TaxID=3070658 RepID=UPI0027DB0F00|nr:TraY domain-containing protein [Nitrosomonas sp. sh817]WMJ08656.1 TraY domain-containing protein [Nitrosomonas sp. sh817]
MLAIKLPEEIENRLAELAAKTGRTKTYYVREAILEHLDELEEKHLTIDRLEKAGKSWTLDEVEKGVDLHINVVLKS